MGTHVDLPFHFSDQGQRMEDFEAEFWIFKKPCLLDLLVEPGHLISPEGSPSWTSTIPIDADLLLLRTGFEGKRHLPIYWQNNPGISAAFGLWIRTHRPSIRALGFDFLSVTSYPHREEGREAHRALLDPRFPGKPVIVIEDMSLGGLTEQPETVWISPLRVEGADGAPATIFAQIRGH